MTDRFLQTNVRLLSELYAADASDSVLLTEYPSSNSNETRFQNDRAFQIHDPFPPPRRELLKYLGPHHLMCGWGNLLPVTSEIAPQAALLEHWRETFGPAGIPTWQSLEATCDTPPATACVTLFPHQSLAPEQQVIDPAIYYDLHSKQAIEKIDCPQAAVLAKATFPCIAKLTHGYAGLGNFFLNNAADETAMRADLKKHWPTASIVINSIIPDITGDYGIQFYLHRDGSTVWLGLTEQHFNADDRWCGGSYNATQQQELFEPMQPFVQAITDYLHANHYFGVVGFDVLKTGSGEFFLVDLNPRLTGITPFLMASRIFNSELGHQAGVYQASCKFDGGLDQLISTADAQSDCKVLVLSAFEEIIAGSPTTTCHLSASGASQAACLAALDRITAK